MSAMPTWDEQLTVRGSMQHVEPMARHSSWRVGGPADHYFEPADRADLVAFLARLPADEPLYWIGLGSNVLVRDGGLRGTVVATTPALSVHEWRDEAHLYAESGVPCARIARTAADQDRLGAEFLAGIPGTLGGALCMNAGALGSEIWDIVAWVETIDREAEVRRRERHEYRADYRRISGPANEWFVAALLDLPQAAGGSGLERIKAVLNQRNATQPTGKASCGSVFKNPPGDYAGRLVEHCGLKGYRIGGCSVSRKHANFIINDAKATAADVEALIEHIQDAVAAATGVRLEPEVQIMGAKAE